jgi:hypothetical protein
VSQDYHDLLLAFTEANVRFLVIGAYALGVHGVPRATGDLDLWVDPSPQNATLVYGALRKFGAPLQDLKEVDLTSPGLIYQVGVRPNRIDVVTGITAVSFQEAWPGRMEIAVEGLRVPIIGRDALIRNKRATGRPRDLLDVEVLEKLQRPTDAPRRQT